MRTVQLLRAALLPFAVAVVPAVGIVAPSPAFAQSDKSYTLTGVTFQGNEKISSEELQAALPIQPGQPIDKAGLQENINAVVATYQKHNIGVKISQRMRELHNKATIAYTLEEQAPVAPTVTHVGITADSVTASGNKKISTADIIAAGGIKPGDQITQAKLAQAQAAISALYKKANIGSSVGTDWTNTAPQHIALVYKIEEKSDD
ncbi:POTRA domain-containing protein [Rhizosaccharibacter radicis]|uniref:POTRA domain-containing protein n=1 Tax=Rhizosaccharibacter radicis TaxID=2782605 RepID=A0ABT1VWD7_9PROT|nr:hypothetical protein [Acetobacteraceae bacterium KSS12]